MFFQLYFLLTVFYLLKASPNQYYSPFLKYNLGKLNRQSGHYSCNNPKYYIKTANLEESKPANQDKIILYHGETYGAWIYQLLLKALLYPEAPEDWLPLRAEILDKEIDKKALLRLVTFNSNDHHTEYKKIGLSVSANLYSNYWTESAWGAVCQSQFSDWHKISGFSDYFSTMHKELYHSLKEKYIPKEQWDLFDMQMELLNYFIQEKRGQIIVIEVPDFIKKFKLYFPETFKSYSKLLKSLFNQEKLKNRKHLKLEGVALQIIMDKEFANQITYNSYAYGYLKDDTLFRFLFGPKPYCEAYKQVKNQRDDEQQARLALTNDFRLYPSRVRIKAIAGIMENPTDFKIVKSMIKKIASFRKDLKDETPKKSLFDKLNDAFPATFF